MAAKEVLYITGYSLLFLAFGVLWLGVFFRGAFPERKVTYLSAVSMGALAFMVALPLQNSLQLLTNSWFTKLQASMWVTGAVLMLISGVMQEAFRTLATWLTRHIMQEETSWLTLGLAVGLGFGVWESWRIVALPLGQNAIWFLPAVIERFSVIGLHIGLGLIVAYGFSKQRPLPYFLLAALWHGVVNYSVILYHGRVFGMWAIEVFTFVMSLAVLVFASRLYYRSQKTES
ncbi:MAG TPA: hypothetical protein DDZ53_07370 [Firmicutes bacterium]|nr:hypothetical protein [Bacillota bacterium]